MNRTAGAAALLTRALADSADQPGDETSERILDAALELAAGVGMRRLTIDDVARRAGVGRMTVYRRFGDRARLVEALTVRETRRGLASVAAALDPGAPVEERVAEGFLAALRVAREHPLLVHLSSFEPEAVLAALNDERDPLGGMLRGFLAEQIREGQTAGELAGVDVDVAAELLLRIGVSFLLIRRSVLDLDDPDEARAFARGLIAPIVTR